MQIGYNFVIKELILLHFYPYTDSNLIYKYLNISNVVIILLCYLGCLLIYCTVGPSLDYLDAPIIIWIFIFFLSVTLIKAIRILFSALRNSLVDAVTHHLTSQRIFLTGNFPCLILSLDNILLSTILFILHYMSKIFQLSTFYCKHMFRTTVIFLRLLFVCSVYGILRTRYNYVECLCSLFFCLCS